MTETQAKIACAAVGAILRKTPYYEYRVTLKEDDREGPAYYTDDIEDAVFTARAMRQRFDRYHSALAVPS